MDKVKEILREEIIKEFIELTNNGEINLSRDKYLKVSKFNTRYKRIFGAYANLRNIALFGESSIDDIIEYKYPQKKSFTIKKNDIMPEKPNCYQLKKIEGRDVLSGLIMSDVHVPFHDKEILGKVIEMIKENHFDFFVLNGDFLDLFSISKYSSNSLYDLKDITLGYEYEEGNKVLDLFDSVLSKDCQKIYLYGNHEERFLKEIKHLDNAKYGNALLDPRRALRLDDRGYQVLENCSQDYLEIGDNLEIIHGFYTNKYFTNKHLEHLEKSVIIGHLHTQQIFTAANGKEGYSIGFLGDLECNAFNYANRSSKARWKQGFITLKWDQVNDNFWINLIRIKDKMFCYEGNVY